ncbi:MAG TPA: S8/S53 family peptidase [Umezawaea sp.]|nr:S8/S53 family peptidase [Umezawaea sp.]
MAASEYTLPELPAVAERDQLIIDRRYRTLVEESLDDLRIQVVEQDEVPAFDLGRLTLHYGTGYPNDFAVDIDAVLAELRWRFAARFGGWTPLLGKNRRLVNQVGAYPQTQSMATPFDPVPAVEPQPVPEASGVGLGVRVGVLDTKLYAHEHLRGRYETPDAGTLLTDKEPQEWENGHCSFVAGLILTHAPGATLVVRDVLDDSGRASTWDTVVRLARFLEDERRVDVLNLSFGCRTTDGRAPAILRRAVERLSPHMVVVAAAGNHGEIGGMVNGVTRNSPTWPAALPDVVSVSTVLDDGSPASYSPVLPWITRSAKADGVTSTYLDGPVRLAGGLVQEFEGYATWRGSSFATAVVSGDIAAAIAPGRVTARDVVAAGAARLA